MRPEAAASTVLGFTGEDLVAVARMGFEGAYVSQPVKAEMLRAFDGEVEGLSG